MNEHGGDKTLAKLLSTMRAIPEPGVSPRAIADAFEAAPNAPPRQIVETARLVSERERRTAALAREDSGYEARHPSRLSGRRSEGERLLASRTRTLVKALDPWVRERRAALFKGEEQPPFRSLAAAAGWIEQDGASQLPEPSADANAADDAMSEALNRLAAADAWTQYRLTGDHHFVRYWRPDGMPSTVYVSTQQRPLYGVSVTSRQIAALAPLTTLPLESITTWFLTGILPGQQVRLTTGQTARMPGLRFVASRLTRPEPVGVHGPALSDADDTSRVVLDMDVRDLTTRNLRVALREVTKRWQQRVKPLTWTTNQRRLVEVVQRLGGPPIPKYQLSFWKRAARQLKWNKDPIAVARMFYRAQPGTKDARR